jgi:predicted MPP superfamily phosphohydrolase
VGTRRAARTPWAPSRRRRGDAGAALKRLLKAAAALEGAAALSLLAMLYEAQWVRRVDRRLPAPGVAPELDGLVVVQLSDFHVGFTPSLNLRAARKAVDLALAAGPDLVAITGDFAGGPYGNDFLIRQLERLVAAAPLGVYAVLGNHDHGHSKAPFVRPTDPGVFARCGVRLLVNETASVTRGEGVVQIGGIDDTDGGHDDLPAVLARLDRRPGVLRLLLSHHAETVWGTAVGDFHMTFSGDTHGGQICLPLPGRRILLSDLRAPFAEGAYDVAGRPLYVTRGVGTSLLPIRAFCRPEVVVFHVDTGAADAVAAGAGEAA